MVSLLRTSFTHKLNIEEILSFLLTFSKFSLRVFSVGAGCCIVGVETDRLIIIRNGFKIFSQFAFRQASVVVGCRIFRVKTDRLIIISNSTFKMSQFAFGKTSIVVG